ncbi:PstS family phosphate ABC transporter substrate-binding protein [Aureliella helgolandensis]|uniref:Phosphate-binding protein PstS n=1 Tax=Aureliella helgolandensis TaxID=2527968 RepID=A0A518G8J4_9BACT|nr:substrate-binding domain-containing protein [Aureliella helgolandensis]QDV24904.1 Phosphate-binding protein PstS precursor [Aureliella helgolandensis]
MARTVLLGLCLLAMSSLSSSAFSQVALDPMLPVYQPISGISGGVLESVGSDTMNRMLTLWAEEFKRFYPGVRPSVDGKGSSNAVPALIAGKCNFGPMSRDVKDSERRAFRAKFGYEPVLLPTSIDMLAVYVNKDNPIEGLAFAQIDAIFSSTRKQGLSPRTMRWSQLAPSVSADISCYGRNAASGTYGYFKEVVLAGGDYGNWVNELPGSAGVVQSVGKNVGGIGYSGIGYQTADVRALKIANEPGGELIEATPRDAYSGRYPLARFLYLAVNYDPTLPLDPMRREFLKYVFSRQGQMQVVKDGYLPLTAEMARDALRTVGIETLSQD